MNEHLIKRAFELCKVLNNCEISTYGMDNFQIVISDYFKSKSIIDGYNNSNIVINVDYQRDETYVTEAEYYTCELFHNFISNCSDEIFIEETNILKMNSDERFQMSLYEPMVSESIYLSELNSFMVSNKIVHMYIRKDITEEQLSAIEEMIKLTTKKMINYYECTSD